MTGEIEIILEHDLEG